MSLFLGNENLISEVNIDNFLSLEQRNKYKYDIQDAVCNESKSTDVNNNNNKNDTNNSNNNNNYDNSNNKEDEIVSIMSETVENNIFNPVSCYIDPARDVFYDSHVNHELECIICLVNIGIKSSQELKFVESDMFCHSHDKIIEFAQLSEKFQDEYRIHFNPEYIKSEFIVKKSSLRAIIKFKKKKNHLL